MLGLLALMRRISLYMAWLGGVLIICSALLVTTEVLLRQFFTISLGGADELSDYALGIASSFAFSFALFERAHIRVDALMIALSPKAQVPLNLLAHILLVGFAAVVTMMVWSMVVDTLEYGSRSITPMRVPLIIPQGLWLLGWVFFVLSGIVIGLVAVWQTVRGDAVAAQGLIGVKSIDEHVLDETA